MQFDLDALPFPFHRQEGQQLRKNLAELYPTAAAARRLLSEIQFDTSLIFFEQAPVSLWHEILDTNARHGTVRTLVAKVHDSLPRTSPLKPFFAALVASRPIEIEAEPLNDDGTPRFIDGDDQVPVPEALLYLDNLTFSIGRVPGLIRTLQSMLQLAPAVCRLDVSTGAGNQFGTAFRVGADLLLTNWHVLHDRAGGRARAVTAEFGYEADHNDNGLAATAVVCDVNSILADQADDWAIIRAAGLQPAWPVVALDQAVEPTLNDAAFIIQHPNGARKRVGFVRNQVTNFTDRVVHYLTDTQEGSSGSPVFDAAGRLIALHHAGGRPQEVLGRPPLKKNEGIRIQRVLAGLKAKGFAIA
ncbi:trypsin-like peptidase domain-containing protein [Nannocystis punicea]|uniref:Serine protease n=1 Tax=Nannocystis punicea TaxID=2995304 RepID=A0ABY7GVR9_9BACT|nr:trypsin-like peptidase domain-containing protein [Nannocystis poenicansa]WAS91065.1 trypsin-like peptidase domain-containing protein [Nannocystis poenicansa]